MAGSVKMFFNAERAGEPDVTSSSPCSNTTPAPASSNQLLLTGCF
jgi:hypothetical protein